MIIMLCWGEKGYVFILHCEETLTFQEHTQNSHSARNLHDVVKCLDLLKYMFAWIFKILLKRLELVEDLNAHAIAQTMITCCTPDTNANTKGVLNRVTLL